MHPFVQSRIGCVRELLIIVPLVKLDTFRSLPTSQLCVGSQALWGLSIVCVAICVHVRPFASCEVDEASKHSPPNAPHTGSRGTPDLGIIEQAEQHEFDCPRATCREDTLDAVYVIGGGA